MTRHACRHCGARIYSRNGFDTRGMAIGSGRYAWTDVADGSDVLGSGSECRANDAGHEPVSDADTRARCASRAGVADNLHHADGTHRTTPASTSGRALERHADQLARHLATLPEDVPS